MNLLIRKLILFISLSAFFLACEDPQDIGKDLQPQNQNFGVLFTDTVTVRTSTVLVDSSRTSITNYMLVGRFSDDKLGTVTAKTFFQARLGGLDTIFTLAESPLYDSLVLYLDMAYSYGDTNQVQQLSVQRLTNSIEERPYYNSEQISYESNPVGNKAFTAKPSRDTLAIKLSDELGMQLFNLKGQSETSFLNAFPGLAFVPGATDDAAIIGYTIGASSKLRLYYRSGATSTKTFYDFPLVGRGFHNIQSDRSNTAIASLQNTFDVLPAALTTEETFIQAGTSIMTKVEIPYLQKLKELGNVAINRAELIVEPVANSINAFTPVPTLLILYQKNALGGVVKNTDNFLIPLFSGYSNSPQIVPYNTTSKTYTFLLNANLNRMLEDKENNTFYLSVPSITLNNLYPNNQNRDIVPIAYSSENTVNRLVIGSSQHATNPLKLKIYYTLVR